MPEAPQPAPPTSMARTTSARKCAANRANARKSTGPRTAAGKARVAQNARRHGLTAPVAGDPALAGDIEASARAICGLGGEPSEMEASDPALRLKLHLARRVAAVQVDLIRVQRVRHQMLAQALAKPHYRSSRGLMGRIRMLSRAGEMMAQGIPLPPEMAHAITFRPQGPAKFALIVADLSRELLAFVRYVERAMSRRKFAVREFDAARIALADPRAKLAASLDLSSESALDLSWTMSAAGRRARRPPRRARSAQVATRPLPRDPQQRQERRPVPPQVPPRADPGAQFSRNEATAAESEPPAGSVAPAFSLNKATVTKARAPVGLTALTFSRNKATAGNAEVPDRRVAPTFSRNRATATKTEARIAAAPLPDKYANMSVQQIRELLWPTGPPG